MTEVYAVKFSRKTLQNLHPIDKELKLLLMLKEVLLLLNEVSYHDDQWILTIENDLSVLSVADSAFDQHRQCYTKPSVFIVFTCITVRLHFEYFTCVVFARAQTYQRITLDCTE